ncbi:MAG: HIT family protein [Ignavibacterium sp.]
MNCVFCDIINKKSQAEILFEDKEVISILDINPMNYGHTLVFPKVHYDDFLSLPNEYIQHLFSTAQIISNGIMAALKPDGFNVILNNGRAAGQSVFHFHLHIIPRYFSDDHRFQLNLKKYKDGEIKEYAQKIRSSINL